MPIIRVNLLADSDIATRLHYFQRTYLVSRVGFLIHCVRRAEIQRLYAEFACKKRSVRFSSTSI